MRTALDGTQIPVSMVYRKDLRQAGAAAAAAHRLRRLWLPSDVHFSSTRLSLLDRGVIFAIGARARRRRDGEEVA